ncbi:GNAT family N-acetyltransferase [Sphaerospermopsis torques-reginae]|uniref:GNAT family N-acetyltransferase n=1 Tax=Sphaerospermopsis torques-reginae ITEP-024 TaxID=984208 RepID=A0ABX8X423_9CYAN|nr:GNAT family N-acetyltransferase [Sphaerospermopsis torques-reginae]QYX33465.1 GNAT family N-acetyltransferase [Sphaerospermopsis torques-reginae ITEP-024]
MNNLTIKIEKLLDTDFEELIKVSREIWCSHYPGVISIEQIEYMLDKMYALEIIEKEVYQLGIFYDKVVKDNQIVGYLSYCAEVKDNINNINYFKLHKCYLLPALHGFGYGQIMLSHVCQKAKEMNLQQIILNVNKRNEKGIKAYTRFGFKIMESKVIDFGGGFVMDDYIMSYEI